MKYIADLHIHSPYSRATSKGSNLAGLFTWARAKGIHVVGTGDFTHPKWLAYLKENLVSNESGLFRLKDENVPQALEGTEPEPIDVRFVLTVEISSIYKKNEKVRKIHTIVFVPDFESVEKINSRLAAIGNIESDGRPILGLDARNLLEIVLEQAPEGFVVPAHIWTPWFSLFGSKSGFDTLEECFEDLSEHIFALETGLSSDPDMNRMISALDRYTLISNSDCHSPSKLGREANLFDTGFDFFSIREALRNSIKNGFVGTVEFFPEEGKYHFDGHRKCNVCLDPEETRKINNICPRCGRALTVGVMHRVRELADRDTPLYPENSPIVKSLIPLPEVISEIMGTGPNTKTVMAEYSQILNIFGSEFNLLINTPIEEITAHSSPILGEAIKRIRTGKIICRPGYDGEFGKILVFNEGELDALSGQINLFKKKTAGTKKAKKPHTFFEKKTAFLKHESISRSELNPEQSEVVHAKEGKLLVLAGPGTGKTFTLISRLDHLLQSGQAQPEHITAITFTNKAAEEVRERIVNKAGKKAEGIFVGTFHAFCLMWLRRDNPKLVVIGEDMREVLLKRLFPEMERTQRKRVSCEISEHFHNLTLNFHKSLPDDKYSPFYQYTQELEKQNAVDLESITALFVNKVKEDSKLRQRLHNTVKFLFVDEFQDLNYSQYEMVKILSEGADVFAIGDPDQAIYGFRGSDPAFFYQFKEQCNARTQALTRNYRSAPALIEAASAVIKNNTMRSNVTLTPESREETFIEHYHAPTAEAEAEFVVMKIEELLGGISHFSINSGRGGKSESTISFRDIGVLYRLSHQAVYLIEAFERRGIPFQIVGVPPFYMTSDIRAAYYWVRAASDTSAPEHLNLLKHIQGIGATTHDKIEKELPVAFTDFWKTLENVKLPSKMQKRLNNVFHNLERFKNEAKKNGLAQALRESMSYLSLNPDSAAYQRFLELAGAFGKDLYAFSHHLELNAASTAYDDRAEAVSLMTLHAAKGLEFHAVFITGLEEGLLPCAIESRKTDVEEERRLFYVGLTRAQENLFLTSSAKRNIYGKTDEQRISRFIKEIPSRFIVKSYPGKRVKKPLKTQLKLF